MDTKSAETVVKIFAILSWIGAVFAVLGGLGMLLGGSFLSSLGGGLFGGVLGGLVVVMGIIMLVIGVLEAFVGFGLWQHKNWARITVIVLGALSLISFPLGTIIGILEIYFFGFDKTVKGLFK